MIHENLGAHAPKLVPNTGVSKAGFKIEGVKHSALDLSLYS